MSGPPCIFDASHPGSLFCDDCAQYFCRSCFSIAHAAPAKRLHSKHLVTSAFRESRSSMSAVPAASSAPSRDSRSSASVPRSAHPAAPSAPSAPRGRRVIPVTSGDDADAAVDDVTTLLEFFPAMSRSDMEQIYDAMGRNRESVLQFLLDEPSTGPAPPASRPSAPPPPARGSAPAPAQAPAPVPRLVQPAAPVRAPPQRAYRPPVVTPADEGSEGSGSGDADGLADQLAGMFPTVPRDLLRRVVRHAGSPDLAVEVLLDLSSRLEHGLPVPSLPPAAAAPRPRPAPRTDPMAALAAVGARAPAPRPVEALSAATLARIDEEFEECRRAHADGFAVSRTSAPDAWLVHLFGFEPDSPLGADLQAYADKYGKADITLEVVFPPSYPAAAPLLRVVRPRFVPGRGPVQTSGAIQLDALTGGQWSPQLRLRGVLPQLRQLLAADGARVDLQAGKEYPRRATAPSQPRAGTFWLRCVAPSRSSGVSDLEEGNLVLLPPAVLHALEEGTGGDLPERMFFRLSSHSSDAVTHCGVREFTAPAGCVVVPVWVMQNLGLDEGALVGVTLADLPGGRFAKLQPQSSDFLDIEDPRRALEVAFRRLLTLTKGDLIRFQHNRRTYYAEVLDLQPADAVHLIDVDLKIDFLPPLDFDPERYYAKHQPASGSGAAAGPGAAAAVAAAAKPRTPVGGVSRPPPPAGMAICDNCDVMVPVEKLETHRLHCLRLRRRCERCGASVELHMLEAHMQREHSMEVCVCGASLERAAMAAHLERECPLRLAECPYCHVISSADEVEQHKGFCGNQTENCTQCGQRCLRKNLAQHMQDAHQITAEPDRAERVRAHDLYRRPDAATAAPSVPAAEVDSMQYPCPFCETVFDSFDNCFTHVQQACRSNPARVPTPTAAALAPPSPTKPLFSATLHTPRSSTTQSSPAAPLPPPAASASAPAPAADAAAPSGAMPVVPPRPPPQLDRPPVPPAAPTGRTLRDADAGATQPVLPPSSAPAAAAVSAAAAAPVDAPPPEPAGQRLGSGEAASGRAAPIHLALRSGVSSAAAMAALQGALSRARVRHTLDGPVVRASLYTAHGPLKFGVECTPVAIRFVHESGDPDEFRAAVEEVEKQLRSGPEVVLQ